MRFALLPVYLAVETFVSQVVYAQSCSNGLATSRSRPVVADGWSFGLVASKLSRPRSILFDSNGALLVVDSGVGIKRLLLEDEGGTCIYANNGSVILNHGIALSNDGRTLYASTPDKVFAWVYDPVIGKVSENNKTVIKDMYNAGHTSRTLLMSDKTPGLLVVSRGSEGNVDAMALRRASGHSQLRVFNVTSIATDGETFSFSRDGKILGWGLRNSVGVVEHPDDGGIWSVENSVDNLERDGVDIHSNNPGEELNFHGFLNGSTYGQGGNYGYPRCLALWSTDDFPRLGNMSTGDQFEASNDRADDTAGCSNQYTAPRLTFQAHSAPLDIVFTPDGSEAFVTFHGSWNREKAVGYALSSIVFDQGSPKELANNTNAVSNVMYNADLNDCPSQCFRPVGLAWDRMDRLFMTSDSTGEIFVLERTVGSTTEDVPSHTAHPSLAITPAVDWSFLLVGVFLMTLRNT
ncbi:hypothetical protein BN1723_002076 [Verticillium longisporum]|uniref:Pyrroloquinoline quinone-dependent pyranose dehydrogenase beta-propeller domain-containing protein n=1 Tax=Verticillium longisporum TaxID=100787 RepID=A0A0G4KVQ0_VERLO|nr:hypothetical protein BN1723_002076 [Verticillium longisporum]